MYHTLLDLYLRKDCGDLCGFYVPLVMCWALGIHLRRRIFFLKDEKRNSLFSGLSLVFISPLSKMDFFSFFEVPLSHLTKANSWMLKKQTKKSCLHLKLWQSEGNMSQTSEVCTFQIKPEGELLKEKRWQEGRKETGKAFDALKGSASRMHLFYRESSLHFCATWCPTVTFSLCFCIFGTHLLKRMK